jgi:hypothetical protein
MVPRCPGITVWPGYTNARVNYFSLADETAHGLHDEGAVGMGCRTEHGDAPGVQLDDERRVVRRESSRGPNLRREEVRRHERRPMRLEERAPRHRALSAGRKACRLQDARNRRPAHMMPHVLHRRLTCGCSPTSDCPWPSARRANGCAPGTRRGSHGCRRRSTSPRSTPGATEEWCRASRGSRLGTIAGGPGDGRVPRGADARGPQDAPPSFKADFQHTILFAEKRHQVLVFTLSPSPQHREDELERRHGPQSTSDVVDPPWDTTGLVRFRADALAWAIEATVPTLIMRSQTSHGDLRRRRLDLPARLAAASGRLASLS